MTMTKFTFVFLMAIIAICLIYCVVMCAVLVHNYCKLNTEYKKVTRELKDVQADVLKSQKAMDKEYSNAISAIKTMEEKDVIGNVWLPKTKGDTHNDKN